MSKLTLIALLLIFSSAYAVQYSYTQIKICIGTECGTGVYQYVYENQFQCYDIGETDEYEICKYGEKNYFCLKMGEKNKQCVVIE